MSSPYSRLNFSMNLTSFYDTRRHSGYVYILNTYFKKHSIGLRCTIYLTYHLRRDSRLLNALTASLVGLSVACFLREHRSQWRMFYACVARTHTRAHAYMHSARKKWSAFAEAAASESHGYPHSDCFTYQGSSITYALFTWGCNSSTAWNIFGSYIYIRNSGRLKSESAHLCVTHMRWIVVCAFGGVVDVKGSIGSAQDLIRTRKRGSSLVYNPCDWAPSGFTHRLYSQDRVRESLYYCISCNFSRTDRSIQ